MHRVVRNNLSNVDLLLLWGLHAQAVFQEGGHGLVSKRHEFRVCFCYHPSPVTAVADRRFSIVCGHVTAFCLPVLSFCLLVDLVDSQKKLFTQSVTHGDLTRSARAWSFTEMKSCMCGLEWMRA